MVPPSSVTVTAMSVTLLPLSPETPMVTLSPNGPRRVPRSSSGPAIMMYPVFRVYS